MKRCINSYIQKHIVELLFLIMTSSMLISCGQNKKPKETELSITNENTSETFDSTPNVLKTEYNEDASFGNEYINIDTSNSSEGYFYINYLGDHEKVKLQVSMDSTITYTYNLFPNKPAVIPLTLGSGTYTLTAYENIQDDAYALVYSDDLDITITNEFGAFLYPNEYVDFNEDSKVIPVAQTIVQNASCDLEAVSMVFDYVVQNITYDYDEAENVRSGYLPDVDEVLETKKGICLDYAALMASMLRSQEIPTRMEIGYAGDAYHAWISVYTKDQGWINSIIEFDGTNWTIMDPTFTANDTNSSLKKLIGEGTEYTTMYTY